MARVTSKLQVTIPRAIADKYGIAPGQEVEWLPAGDAIRVVPHASREKKDDRALRLELFDAATERQRGRESAGRVEGTTESESTRAERGWHREDLYDRGDAG